MDQIFQPIGEMLSDLLSSFMGIVNTIAVLGIVICGVGALTGSQESREKFKKGLIVIIIAYMVIQLSRAIISVVGGYF